VIRRRFLLAGLGGALLGLFALSRLRLGIRPQEPASAAPFAVRQSLIAFMGALFGRDLTAEDRADLSDRLALFTEDAALRHDCSVFADYLDRLAREEHADDFAGCEPTAKQRIVERVMAIDPHSLSARVLAHLSERMRVYYRMRWSIVPSLEWMYRHSAAAWRARGYSRWPGVPGDWRESLVPGLPYP
jgi:hypothetical protein